MILFLRRKCLILPALSFLSNYHSLPALCFRRRFSLGNFVLFCINVSFGNQLESGRVAMGCYVRDIETSSLFKFLHRVRWGNFESKLGIFRNKYSILTKSLEILKSFFRFSYIESFVILGNLFPFLYPGGVTWTKE